ncbi:unnamed protein product [Prorocentrum cordatum]|uniref:Uncharacterized protein n=1 Tax=Prorocentrum cordatum TaxID=2364126 RepID=A0ABN9VGG6_9DINO|nr:unnamed protein product [Polarella glacialis]
MVAAGEPHRGVAGARASADRLIFKLKNRLVAADRKALACESALLHLFGDAEVAERVACILPALTSPLAGERPEALDILRRNVALHSEGPCGVSLVSAGRAELRKAQKHARRLEAKRADTQPAAHVLLQSFPPLEAESGLRRDAPPFVPSSGCWVPLDGCGRLCTCGATCYSSCSPLPLSVEEVFEDHGDEDAPCGEAADAEFPTRGVPPALVDGSEGVSGAAGPPQDAVPVSQPGSAAARRAPGWWLARAVVARVWLGPSRGEDADVEAKLVADVIVSVSEEVGDGIEGATLDGVDGGVDEKGELTVELEALAGRLGALVEGAEPTVELKGDLAALSVRQGALEESAEATCELEALSQRPCALEATSEQLVSQKGDLAALSEQRGTLAEGAELMGEREVLSRPLYALEALCEQREAKMASRHVFSESLFYFLDDFTVAAMMCVAIGPKSGVESLLSSAEARFIDVRPGSVGWPNAEKRERIFEGRLQVVQMPRGVRGPLDE